MGSVVVWFYLNPTVLIQKSSTVVVSFMVYIISTYIHFVKR
jgi:hypothetical protein